MEGVADRSVTRTVSLDLYRVIESSFFSFRASRFILREIVKVLLRLVEFGIF